MTLEEATERVHCSVKTVRRRIASGELRASRIARGRWVITEEDLQAYLDATANRPREGRLAPAPNRVQPPAKVRAPRRRRARGQSTDGRLVVTDDMGRRA